jgi:hypothetical protein
MSAKLHAIYELPPVPAGRLLHPPPEDLPCSNKKDSIHIHNDDVVVDDDDDDNDRLMIEANGFGA